MKHYIVLYTILLNLLFAQDKSIYFDGFDDFIRISDHPQLDLTTNYTIEAWIFTEQFTWLGGIVSKYHTNAANGYLLRLSDISPYTGISFDEKRTSIGILNTNQWYHIAGVNDQGTRKLYINGNEQNLTGPTLNVTVNDNNLKIGSDYGGRFFKGRIDEVRLWGIPRSQEDINTAMSQNLLGNEEGLIAYYTFDEGTGDTLFDQSNNNHHGLLRGSPVWVDGHSLSGTLGDINFDESIDIYDAVMLVTLMLGYETGSPLQIHASDINQDGSIDIIDIITLIQMVLELDTTGRSILTQAKLMKKNNNIHFKSNGEILGFEILLSTAAAVSHNGLPSNWSWHQKENKIIGFSMDGSSLPTNFEITLPVKNKIEQIYFGGWNRNLVRGDDNLHPKFFEFESGPNPFNPKCNISFRLESDQYIQIQIYNIKGQFVHNLIDEKLKLGLHNYTWKPKNLSSGTYFIRLNNKYHSQTNKILFLK